MSFNVGDIVQLKSGSCEMVVEGHEPVPGAAQPHLADRLVRCVWMAPHGAVASHAFEQHLLVGKKKDEPEPARDMNGNPPRE